MIENPYSREENEPAWTAWQCLTQTGVNIFLTGKAGTGKTTFLKKLCDSHIKNMVITAPTGVAAINAGGVTLHSFFQLPIGTFAPGETPKTERGISKEKRKVMRSMELLVIDEVSMVRADLLDLVDYRLREQRGNDKPFGGVQLLLIGDLMQLSPVVRPEDAEVLSEFYPSFYFFASKALGQTRFFTISLNKIYRQTDSKFISLLNHVRQATMTTEDIEELNSRCKPDFKPGKDSGYVRMTTHVKTADEVNDENLASLDGEEARYESKVDGEFPEKSYPTTTSLTLKVGTQAMFIRNGSDQTHSWYNGMIVKVVKLDSNRVVVESERGEEINVGYATWENIKYVANEKSGEPEAKVIGTFSQIPLALAWAITIHKSQGLTFDKAIIDASRAFSPGQVYVALSRCRTLEGMILSSPIPETAIKTDPAIKSFLEDGKQHPITARDLDTYANSYSMDVMTDLFTFDNIFAPIRKACNLMQRDYGGKYPKCEAGLLALLHEDVVSINSVAQRFLCKCQLVHSSTGCITSDADLMSQAQRGAKYFAEKLDDLRTKVLSLISITPDDAAGRKRLTNLRNTFKSEIAIGIAVLTAAAEEGFTSDTVTKARSIAMNRDDVTEDSGDAAQSSEANEVVNKELFEALRKWRKKKAEEDGKPAYVVVANKQLFDIADMMPSTVKELAALKGMGKEKIRLYANDILNIVSEFRKKGVKAARALPTGVRPQRQDTKVVSLEAFRRLGSVEAVAKERGLTKGTVSAHLMTFVGTELTTDEVMGAERHKRLTELVSAMGDDDKPGDEIWGEFLNSEYHQVRKELGREKAQPGA